IPLDNDYLAYTLREPWGVCGIIIPWNYPLQMVGRCVGAALAAGNTVVLKPAEQAPLTAVAMARLALESGLPPGVFNVVPGFGPEAGAHLAGHPGIDHLSFTGSEIGRASCRERAQGGGGRGPCTTARGWTREE